MLHKIVRFKALLLRNVFLILLVILSSPLLLLGWYGLTISHDVNDQYKALRLQSTVILLAAEIENLLKSEVGHEATFNLQQSQVKRVLSKIPAGATLHLLNREGALLISSDELSSRTVTRILNIRERLSFSQAKKVLSGTSGVLVNSEGSFASYHPVMINKEKKEYWIVFFRHNQDSYLSERLIAFKSIFISMVILGGFLSGLTWLYYLMRIYRPIRLIVAKNSEKDVKSALIESSLIRDDELGQIMTSRNKMLKNLAKSNNRIENVLNSLYDALFVFSADKQIEIANPAALRLLGLKEEDVLGQSFDFLFNREQEQWISEWKNEEKIPQSMESFETTLMTQDGKSVPVLCSLDILHDETDQFDGIVFVAQDISQLKKDEEQISMLSTVVEQSPISILITDSECKIEYVNPWFLQKTGYTAEEVSGKNPRFLQDDREDSRLNNEIWETVSSGGTWKGELRNKKRSGNFFWGSASVCSIKNKYGKITHYLEVIEDITDRKRMEAALIATNEELETRVLERVAELRAANQHLEEAYEKLKSLDKLKDEFLATVSHELRTPLASILGYADTLAECELPEKERQRFYQILIEESERLSQLIENILDMSTLAAGHVEFLLEDVYLNDQVKRAIESVEGLLFEKNNIKIKHQPTDIQFLGDGDRIIQVLINLLGNAIKFSPENGTISVGVEKRESYFIVSITDEGPGIPQESLQQIFGKFQKVKRDGVEVKGTGLGLTISQRIIDAHSGRIWAENSKEGAIFRFSLPYTLDEIKNYA
ncbi:MAG: hypothetical protein COB67_00895 [SAR324 cluster bacterium]|uniref:histidine kinase n=1 Tax=SAR324 cluster bacterium TaxID=2024889 RepID=A0A2A4TBN6_9DELT|nr:MAG: hypothetical protein COB67_00895 [SAR324 cluster bacterium]